MRIFQRIHQKLKWSTKAYFMLILGLIGLSYLGSAVYHSVKPLPEGLEFKGELRHAEVKFLADQIYINSNQQQVVSQQIFDEMLKMIAESKSLIVLDMFLFNAEVGESNVQHRKMTQELSDALINQKTLHPEIEIKLITDPINSVYGGVLPDHYRQLRQAGIDVIETNLTPLRSANPLWSGIWYLCCQGLGNNSEKGWLPNPFGTEKITIRSFLHLANFKANHRKTLVVDTEQGWKALVTSMNPHDGSSRHANVALVVKGSTAIDVLRTEQTVGMMSQANMPAVVTGNLEDSKNLPQVQLLTEKAIYHSVLDLLKSSKNSDTEIDLAMFYLSERNVIQELIAAHQRGVKVRVLLDPNKDAFGRTKNGIPNRPVAAELHQAGIPVKWCNTQGEQCHSKMLIKHHAQQTEMILGSANFTARNLKNYNLETDLRVIGASDAEVFKAAQQFFDQAWNNSDGKQMSVEYEHYADESKLKYGVYRFMEWSGLSTF